MENVHRSQFSSLNVQYQGIVTSFFMDKLFGGN